MSSIAEYRALLDRADSFAVKVEPFGLISLRVPSGHQRAMALASALDAHGGRIAASIASRRAIVAQSICAWSVSAADLLGGKVSIDDADAASQPLPCSAEAAELLFDVAPQVYQQLSDALFAEMDKREAALKEASKN